jgi:hypothetical protein
LYLILHPEVSSILTTSWKLVIFHHFTILAMAAAAAAFRAVT